MSSFNNRVNTVVPKPESGNRTAINESEGPVVLKLTIPGELYSFYSDLAENQELTVADLMLHRLQRCKGHTSLRSLYFSETQLRALEGVLQKRPIETADQAVSTISAAFQVKVGDFEPVPITANQAKRIRLGAIGGMTVQEKLAQIVQGAIAKATGA